MLLYVINYFIFLFNFFRARGLLASSVYISCSRQPESKEDPNTERSWAYIKVLILFIAYCFLVYFSKKRYFFRISTDRHKAELRRAVNDERLFTIAKRLSHDECVTSEWLQQSRRLIPLLPRLQHNSNVLF